LGVQGRPLFFLNVIKIGIEKKGDLGEEQIFLPAEGRQEERSCSDGVHGVFRGKNSG
jgi:hypothetical protein